MSKKIYKAILIVLSLFFVIDLTCTPITLEKWRNRVSDTPNLSSSIKKEIEIETKTMSEIDLLKYSLKKLLTSCNLIELTILIKVKQTV